MKKKFTLGLFTIGIIISSLSVNTTTTLSFVKKNQIADSLILNLVPHGPIIITHDDNFTDYGFSGIGTANNPYIIENYEIITSSENGIYIANTTKYFVIRNCYLDAVDWGLYIYEIADGTASIINNTVENNIYGMSLWHSSSFVIINNTCRYNTEYGIQLDTAHESIVINNTCSFNNAYGIYQWNSENSTFTNNTCIDNYLRGIYLQDCFNASITSNICNGGSWDGIYLLNSANSTLYDNLCHNNQRGIRLQYSPGITLDNNTCNNNQHGIYLDDSSDAIVMDNTCRRNSLHGIRLEHSYGAILTNNSLYESGLSITDLAYYYSHYTIENNWMNDKKLGFYVGLNQAIFSTPIYGQLILINCNDVVVCNQELSDTSTGLFLSRCENANIFDNTCNNNKRDGITVVYFSNNVTLTDNICSYNRFGGITLDSSEGAKIVSNTCNNNGGKGMNLFTSSDMTVVNNTCNNNKWYGINQFHSDNITLIDNTCSNNEEHGIVLWYSPEATVTNNTISNNKGNGIYLYHSSNSILTKNIIKNNSMGIDSEDSENCFLTYNLIQENKGHGILLLDGSNNNTIHHNTFIDNNPGGTSQASDNGENNTWYDITTEKGNHWSDWDSKKPYPIDGTSNVTDPYPLNEKLKRINYQFIMLIPSITLLAILYRFIRRRKQKYMK